MDIFQQREGRAGVRSLSPPVFKGEVLTIVEPQPFFCKDSGNEERLRTLSSARFLKELGREVQNEVWHGATTNAAAN